VGSFVGPLICERHPHLHGVAAVRAQVRVSDAGIDWNEGGGDATLDASLRGMRSALDTSLAAVARLAELAKQTASAHAETVAALRQTIRACEAAAVAEALAPDPALRLEAVAPSAARRSPKDHRHPAVAAGKHSALLRPFGLAQDHPWPAATRLLPLLKAGLGRVDGEEAMRPRAAREDNQA
jgi:hypothetical protein